MHLEAQLAENTAAIKELTAAILESNKSRDAAVAAVAGVAEPAKRTRGRPAAPDAPAPDPAASAPAVETPAAPAAIPSIDDVRGAASAYLETTDAEVRTQRKLFVKAVIDHLGATTVAAIVEEDRAKAIGWFNTAKAGGKVDFDAGQDEATADDDMLG
jgi:hypothetical protein